jgi:DNA polymerase I
LYLTFNENYWACDIEGDNLPSSVVWCMCVINIQTREERAFSNLPDIVAFVEEEKAKGAKFIFHNGIGYDAPTLNRLLGTRLTIADLIDTMVMSMLYSPSLAGGHSLAAWGDRMRDFKGEFNDFSKFSEEMLTYCSQDAHLCRKVYLELVKRMIQQGFTEKGIEIEHRSWQLVKKQQDTGFHFDIAKAHALYAKLRELENTIKDKLHEYWPPSLERVASFKRPFKQDGAPTANYLRHCETYERVSIRPDGSEYDCYGYVAFHIGSPVQRVDKLLELGWKPSNSELTPTGQPKPTDKGKLVPSLETFVETSGKEEPRLIARWIEINSRANMINTWMEAYNETTKCIHGNLWIANTLRYKHSGPNTANIPAVRVSKDGDPLIGMDGVYTYEARDLWATRDSANRRLVGVDAKGIQLRVLAQYLNNPKFTEAVIEGDPHAYNMEIGGFRSRAIAKTFIYAFLLGAGDGKVGQIIGGSTKDGGELKRRFVGNFPGLKGLLDNLEYQIQRGGRIRLCDGTPLIVSAMHTRLGYLLQGDESRLMKQAAILVARENNRRNLDILKVGDIHDEWQNDSHKDHVEEFTDEVCPRMFARSGELLGYRVPIACDSKVGLTWAETH